MRRIALWIVSIGILGALVGTAVIYVFLGPTQIVVANRSSESLRDVIVSGRGFEVRIFELRSGESSCHSVDVAGESSVRIEARLRDQPIDSRDVGYLEGSGGYRVVLSVFDSGEIDFQYDFEGLNRLLCSPAV